MNHIVVLGMHRSGTSAMAGFLSEIGFHPGLSLLTADEGNIRGYFEHNFLVNANNIFLKSLGSAWDDFRPLSINLPNLESKVFFDVFNKNTKFKEELSDAIYDDNFVLKDPRLCRLLPLWQPVWTNWGWKPRYVLMLRHPDEVVASLQHRDGMAAEHAYLLYVSYLLDAEYHTRNYFRAVVYYPNLLSNAEDVWQQLVQKLNIKHSEKFNNIQMVADGFLTNELRHHRSVVASNFVAHDLKKFTLGKELAYRLWSILVKNNALESDADLILLDSLRSDFLRYVSSIDFWINQENKFKKIKENIFSDDDLCREIVQADAIIQIFWAENINSFKEENSIKLPLRFSSHPQEFCFFMPKQDFCNIQSIRLDLSSKPFFGNLKRIEIWNENNECVWSDIAGVNSLLDLDSSLDFLEFNEDLNGVIILSNNFDAKAIINIPRNVLCNIKAGWCLKVFALIDLPIFWYNYLIKLIKDNNEISKKLKNNIKELEGKFFEINIDDNIKSANSINFKLIELLGCVNYKINEKREDLINDLRWHEKKMYEQILRVKAQLEFLKKLYQDDDFL